MSEGTCDRPGLSLHQGVHSERTTCENFQEADQELLPPFATRRFTIGQVVKGDAKATFSHYRDEKLFYTVEFSDPESPETGILRYQFPITVEEAKGGVFLKEHKAITLMRWIRKAMESHDFWPAR